MMSPIILPEDLSETDETEQPRSSETVTYTKLTGLEVF